MISGLSCLSAGLGDPQPQRGSGLLLWVALVNLQDLIELEIFIGIIQAITSLTVLALPSSTLDYVP